ncbi:MAG TPA: helix-turn-helix transcriptional regulator, partial [Amycolatopsis sp.]|nr:helix-turn-helix transcriptional regulator [Amycolatopsis sp.]
MKPTMSPTPRVRALAASIREAREARRISVRQLAEVLGFSPAMLSQWERAIRVPTVAQVGLILGYLQVAGERQDHILELARTAREPNWLTESTSDIGPALTGLLQCERTAIRINCWALTIVPGLFQTADYARSILSSGDLTLSQVDARLIVRLGRQEILTCKAPIQLNAIISERALYEPVGSEDTMSDQIDHLHEVSKLPNVSLRVLT